MYSVTNRSHSTISFLLSIVLLLLLFVLIHEYPVDNYELATKMVYIFFVCYYCATFFCSDVPMQRLCSKRQFSYHFPLAADVKNDNKEDDNDNKEDDNKEKS